MTKVLLLIPFLLCVNNIVLGQRFSASGKVAEQRTKEPMEQVLVVLPDYNLWAVTNEKGEFKIDNIPHGCTSLSISSLGYDTQAIELCLEKDTVGFLVLLQEKNLALNEVVVTARRKANEATTSYQIDRTTLDHAQILDVSDISSLLPGEATSPYYTLTNEKRFALRSGNAEIGNVTLGTAVEIDGVRLSGNADMGARLSSGVGIETFSKSTKLMGTDTRSISSTNIESIEIITGVPSVEHGDLTSGVVKINTKKGETPLVADILMQPNTKQYGISKGFALGAEKGVLNTSLEHTNSISDLASPHTSYKRNILSLAYSNTLGRKSSHPVTVEAGVTGNIGGYHSKSDPDYFRDTYEKQRDNVIRGHINTEWMLGKPWLTSLSVSASANYNDRLVEINNYKSSVPAVPSLHGREEGYFMPIQNPDAITLLPANTSWYELGYIDNKFLNQSAKMKAKWAWKFGELNSRLMAGADYNRSENKGRGIYYDDIALAPNWREYRYDELPASNELSFYAQEQLDIPIRRTSLQLTAGVRSDFTIISGSNYGTVGSLSPRFNAKYLIPVSNHSFVKDVIVRAGWGEAVKLPTFAMLYPQTKYSDKIVFATSNAYRITPVEPYYNPDLKWQKERLQEIGADVRVKGFKVSLSFFSNKTLNPYVSRDLYTPLAYNYTDYAQLEGIGIPAADRQISIDRNTGIVTVSDKTGANPSQQLAATERHTFKSSFTSANGSPIHRKGIEWIVDIDKIPALQTSFRFDGKYYYYKGVDESINQYLNQTKMVNGDDFGYIAYYAGVNNNSPVNGKISKQLNTNLTVTTHIPKIRLIVSLRIESCLYSYSQNLSEYNGRPMGFVYDPADSHKTPDWNTDIYSGNKFVASYPLYYSTYDDANTLIPFAEKLEWAKTNDRDLYNELFKLIQTTSFNYMFNEAKLSAYFSGNIAVTKEIGRYVSISFKATNFFQNMGKVHSSQNDRETSLYNNANYISRFYYGLSLQIKL